jgi:hypothetical protein
MMRRASSILITGRSVRHATSAFAIFCAGLLSTPPAKAEPPSQASAPNASADASASAAANNELVTFGNLQGLGIHVYRKRLDTPGASLTLEITVDENATVGRFVRAECIVLRDREGMKDIATVDASADLDTKAARRNSSDKTDSTFLVLGREIDRAYLVFEFSNAGKPDQRYLLPVTSVPKRRA